MVKKRVAKRRPMPRATLPSQGVARPWPRRPERLARAIDVYPTGPLGVRRGPVRRGPVTPRPIRRRKRI